MCDLAVQGEQCCFETETALSDTYLLLIKIAEFWTTVIAHSAAWKSSSRSSVTAYSGRRIRLTLQAVVCPQWRLAS